MLFILQLNNMGFRLVKTNQILKDGFRLPSGIILSLNCLKIVDTYFLCLFFLLFYLVFKRYNHISFPVHLLLVHICSQGVVLRIRIQGVLKVHL